MNVHERSTADARKMADPKPEGCRTCFACILNCPRGALTARPSADYLAQGDADLHSPDHPLDPGAGRRGEDPRERGRLRRPVRRPRLRRHLARYVGDRPPHAGRDPRPRAHLDDGLARARGDGPLRHAVRLPGEPEIAHPDQQGDPDPDHPGPASLPARRRSDGGPGPLGEQAEYALYRPGRG